MHDLLMQSILCYTCYEALRTSFLYLCMKVSHHFIVLKYDTFCGPQRERQKDKMKI